MFKKPFKVKSNSQLKGSDRKKLRNDILKQFPELPEDTINNIVPNKETIFQLKLITHSNEIVIAYAVQKLPILFEVEKVMYPTVYMLWHAPHLLHTFTTHPTVFPVITQGADLMLPGVVLPGGPNLYAYGKLAKGDRVAVNITSNKAPVAVGVAANSSYDMYMSGNRGKCVQILHYYGDTLSLYGTKLVVPQLGPVFQSKPETSEDDPSLSTNGSDDSSNVETLSEDIEQIKLSANEMDVKESDDGLANSTSLLGAEDTKTKNGISDIHSSHESMDDLLQYCFFKSLRTSMKKVDLPLLTSTFYKLHMIPACPEGKSLDVKKSSYKKLSNFLEAMVKLGAVSVESLQKGVQSISKIDYNCESVKQFVDNNCDEAAGTAISIDTSVTGKSAVPEITEKFTVTAAVLPLFYNYDYKKKDALDASIVHKVIGDYVKVKHLQNPENKSEVVLDDVLRSATNSENVEVMKWEQLVLSVFKQMGHAFKVELAGNQQTLNKGKLPPIDIQVGTRSGNKKVTLVNNLELYGINLAEFSRECQHGVAASTTINTIPSAKSAQLQIQGNQVIFVAKLLTEKYQIPKRYLRGLENAPKKKK